MTRTPNRPGNRNRFEASRRRPWYLLLLLFSYGRVPGSFIVHAFDFPGMTWWQVVFAGYDGFAGLGLKLKACASGDSAAGLGSGFIFS